MFNIAKLANHILSSSDEEKVVIQEDRCVRLKHKRSTCKTCVTNCPTGAIQVGNVRGHIHIDRQKCIACGICTNVCNTEVFSLNIFSDRDLLDRSKMVIQTQNKLEIKCKKAQWASPNSVVEINCLGLVNPVHILAFAAYGAEAVHFRHADCKDCEAKCGDETIARAIDTAESMLNAFCINEEILITSGDYSAAFSVSGEEKGMSRREFFRVFTQQPQNTKTNNFIPLQDIEQKPIRRPLDFTHKFLPQKRILLLAVLQALGKADENLLDTSTNPILTDLDIELEKCGICGSCARFCPTGALSVQEVFDTRGKRLEGTLHFDPAICVKCDLCLASCFTQALNYSPKLDKHSFINQQERLLKQLS